MRRYIGEKVFQKEIMVPVTATCIANSGRDGAGLGYQFFQRFIFIGRTRDRFVQVVNISLVVLAMMDLHGGGINMRFKRIMCIGQGS